MPDDAKQPGQDRCCTRGEEQKLKKRISYGLAILAIVLAIVSFTLVFVWVDDWLGTDVNSDPHRYGLDWKDKKGELFNFHPLFMTTGMVCLNIFGVITYRFGKMFTCDCNFGERETPHWKLKLLHGFIQTSALTVASFGIYAVFENHSRTDPVTPDVFSPHDWIGMTTFLAFSVQWLLAMIFLALPHGMGMPDWVRTVFMPMHIMLGIFTLIGAAAAVVSGLSMQLAYDDACKYNTAYDKMSTECSLVMNLALTVVFGIFAALAALMLISNRHVNGVRKAREFDDRESQLLVPHESAFSKDALEPIGQSESSDSEDNAHSYGRQEQY